MGLATMHAYGIGVPESTRKTVQLLTQACQAKSGVACGRFAEFHRAGIGVTRDRDKAREVEDLACRLGRERACQLHSASGCRSLAVALSRGLGGAADPGRAAASNELACRWGAEDGCATPRAGRALKDR